jgi:hypothetical protein
MRCLPVALLVLLLECPAGAAEPTPMSWWKPGGPRVRPYDTRIATLLLDGLRRSAYLGSLVDRIEASDVIVYLELQPRLDRRLAGCLTWLTSVGKYRYVRASINSELPPQALIAAIGHELQHVIEVIENPSVTGPESLLTLYKRIGSGGPPGSPVLDTQAARDAGALVRKDLRAARSTEAIPGGHVVSPLEWHEWYRQRPAPELR